MKVVALVGQPNSGKSTIFNQIAGYKSIISNFPGTTVEFITSEVKMEESFMIVDLPGSYSLSSTDEAESETRKFLMQGNADVVVNVVDASSLMRSLNLTIELIEFGIPLVLCLNMMDEARRKGIEINVDCLSKELGVPVIPTVATRGEGIKKLFEFALRVAEERKTPERILNYSKDVEKIVKKAEELVKEVFPDNFIVSRRFLAIKALEGDEEIHELIKDKRRLEELRREIEESHGKPSDVVVASERHSLALHLFSKCVKVERGSKKDFRERIDEILTHKYLGFLVAGLVLYLLFFSVFSIGGIMEERLMEFFETFSYEILRNFPEESSEYVLLNGLLLGISGGIAIVLPYLIPFLLFLAILEDVGYIPRVAFLLDGAFHKMGLHGGAIIPLVLGYGCSVPAVMATRTIGSRSERIVVTALSVMIPCSARTVVILGLVGHFIGLYAALLVYFLNLAVIVVAGFFMSKTVYGDIFGLIMEIPPLRVPSFKNVLLKTWLRAREFVVIAFPILIAGSAFLSLIEFYRLDGYVNLLFAPLTSLLGLPSNVGMTLIFGILRKELTLIMLTQIMGTYDLSSVLSNAQIMSFAIFTTFYIPCLATIGVMMREIGKKYTLYTILMTFSIATVLGALARILLSFNFH